MSKIIIEPKDKEEEHLILSFLKAQNIQSRLLSGGAVGKRNAGRSPDQYNTLASILDQKASSSLFKSIDPIAWQRTIRDEW